ncbi:hypothetical protein D3C75_903390 [compost metagenome]
MYPLGQFPQRQAVVLLQDVEQGKVEVIQCRFHVQKFLIFRVKNEGTYRALRNKLSPTEPLREGHRHALARYRQCRPGRAAQRTGVAAVCRDVRLYPLARTLGR